MHRYNMVSISIILLLSLCFPEDSTASKASDKYIIIQKDVFEQLYKDRERLAIFVVNGSSCSKCYFAHKRLANKVQNTGTDVIAVIMVNRLVDSVTYADYIDTGEHAFMSRGDIRNWIPERNENAWYFYCADSANLIGGRYLDEGSGEALLTLCRRQLNSKKKVRRMQLSILDETSGPIVKPTFNQYISDSILVVGSDADLVLRAFNAYDGAEVWNSQFSENDFSNALDSNESIAHDRMMFRPGIIAAEWYSDSSVFAVGTIVSSRFNPERGRTAIGVRNFISEIDPRTNRIKWVKSPALINDAIAAMSMYNAQIRYPKLFITQCPWDAKGEAVYESNTLSVVDIASGEVIKTSPLDSAYKILGIEDNIANGYFCSLNGELWTGQPLRPYIRNEATGRKMKLIGRPYHNYYDKLYHMSRKHNLSGMSAYEKYKTYHIESLLSGMYSLGDNHVAIMMYRKDGNGATHEWLDVYDVRAEKMVWSQEMVPGWTIQMGETALMRVELVDNRYVVATYTID